MSQTAIQNTPNLWLKFFPFPSRDGNKYDRGHALIYGGAVLTGATRLSARAAQRIGAGVVTLAAMESAFRIYAEALESVMVQPVNDLEAWKKLLTNPKMETLLIGPGLGLGMTERKLVLAAVDQSKPCVIDADGISNFADSPHDLLSRLHTSCILTPHEGEFGRLFGTQVDMTADKLTRARSAAKIAGCIVLLKGADTIIAAPNDNSIIINNNGPPWLATAGAGDVLAGLILGLITQKMPVYEATAAAAWLHGSIAKAFGGPGMIAEDIVAGIPLALKSLSEASKRV